MHPFQRRRTRSLNEFQEYLKGAEGSPSLSSFPFFILFFYVVTYYSLLFLHLIWTPITFPSLSLCFADDEVIPTEKFMLNDVTPRKASAREEAALAIQRWYRYHQMKRRFNQIVRSSFSSGSLPFSFPFSFFPFSFFLFLVSRLCVFFSFLFFILEERNRKNEAPNKTNSQRFPCDFSIKEERAWEKNIFGSLSFSLLPFPFSFSHSVL